MTITSQTNKTSEPVLVSIDSDENPAAHPLPTLVDEGDFWRIVFTAMASPCEILVSKISAQLALNLTEIAAIETWRIEHKYSRYVKGNIMDQINQSDGRVILLDDETLKLLDFARQCYELSHGAFDITSGILRRAWRFNGSDVIPEQSEIEALLPLIGFNQLKVENHSLVMSPGMELDFGGIGKEYAVDRVLLLLSQYLCKKNVDAGVLVNFGGDLACSGPRSQGTNWHVGVESTLSENTAVQYLQMAKGAIATSGDSRRYLLKDGVRYSHILNPITGWPIENPPHSVTVCTQTCTLAGMMATFSMLNGENAESFLEAQGVQYWVQR